MFEKLNFPICTSLHLPKWRFEKQSETKKINAMKKVLFFCFSMMVLLMIGFYAPSFGFRL